MITGLKLTNFKRHEALEIALTSGLQVLRGANEAGKSTIFRAVAYALFGSRALELSLEETVTWGKPVASLKVELAFVHNKVNYTIVRKKSGAELVSSDGVTASGQAEVTAFIERLFGANANIAQATMLANQASLQDGQDSSAMPLIERLANMRLIDELIDKVQQKLPSGSTKGLEAQIHAIADTQRPVLDIAEDTLKVTKLRDDLNTFKVEVAEAETILAKQTVLAKSGKDKQTKNDKATDMSNLLKSQIVEAEKQLVVQDFVAPDIAKMESDLAKQEDFTMRAEAFKRFQKLPAAIDGISSEVFSQQCEESELRLKMLLKEVENARTDLTLARASQIAESSCSFCGKNFSDVPEVMQKIEASSRLIADYQEKLDCLFTDREKVEARLKELYDLRKHGDALRRLLPIPFVVLDESTVPPTASWQGGDVPDVNSTITKADITKARAAIAAHEKCLARVESARKVIEQAQDRLVSISFETLTPEEVEAMLSIDANTAEIVGAKLTIQNMESRIRDTEHSIALAENTFNMRMKAYEKDLQQKKDLLELLSNYHFNNGIIQKLREARPAVAAKLWALVLTGVSYYFSAIRGSQSTVTRGEKGFLIDGKVAEAFSGSTRDSLGLAIRIMLQKTFLPNVTFMLVDEPGAACDDSRESDMLAVLASCGLEQVLLVTHSDLADTFASNVVQI